MIRLQQGHHLQQLNHRQFNQMQLQWCQMLHINHLHHRQPNKQHLQGHQTHHTDHLQQL